VVKNETHETWYILYICPSCIYETRHYKIYIIWWLKILFLEFTVKLKNHFSSKRSNINHHEPPYYIYIYNIMYTIYMLYYIVIRNYKLIIY